MYLAIISGNHFSNLFIETRIIGKFLMIRPFLFFSSREDKFCILPIKPLHLSLLRFLTIILWKFNDLERLMPYILFIFVWSSVLVHPASTWLAWPHFWSTLKGRFLPLAIGDVSNFGQKSSKFDFQSQFSLQKSV